MRRDITLVGTAHISEDSALLVQQVLRQVRPDTVMVELDASRATKLLAARPDSVRSAAGTTAAEAERAPPFSMGRLVGRVMRGDLQEAKADAVGVGLASMYKQLDQMGFQSGAEFVVAVKEAEALGATLLLGDRDAREARTRHACRRHARRTHTPPHAHAAARLLPQHAASERRRATDAPTDPTNLAHFRRRRCGGSATR